MLSRILGLFLLTTTLLFGAGSAFSEQDTSQVLFLSSDSLTPVKVQINWHHQFQFAGFYAAIKQGFYRDAGLDVTIQSWQPGMNLREEVLEGRATFGTAYSSVIADFIKGEPIQVLMTSFQYSPMVLLSKEPITELSQLSGKTVSHYNNLQILALLHRAKPEITEPLITAPPTDNLEDFIEGRVDLYGAYETNEPYQLIERQQDYHLVNPNLFGVNGAEDYVIVSQNFARQHPELVESFRQATIAGWHYAIENQAEVVDFILQNYPVIKSRQALLYEANATTKYVRSGTTPIGTIEPAKILATALEVRDVGLITQAELEKFQAEQFLVRSIDSLKLTREELLYLSENPVIHIGNDIHWNPIEFIDAQGTYQGIVAEYFKLFEQRLGVRFKPVATQDWSEVLDRARKGDIDLLSAAVSTPEREQFLAFTEPYLSFPMALVASDDAFYINNYQALMGHKVAVVKNYWSHEYLKDQYPDLDLLLVDNVQQGLEAVLQGKAKVYSGNLAVINFTAKKLGLSGLSVVSQFDQQFDLAIGVQKDNPILLSILQKTLDSLTSEEHSEIYDQWIHLEMVSRLDKRQLVELSLTIGAVLLILLVGLFSYRYQKQRAQAYIERVHELTFASLVDAKTFHTLWASESYQKLCGYSLAELKQLNYMQQAAHSVDQADLDKIAQRVLSGQVWQGEMKGLTKQGEFYWLELTLSPQRDFWGQLTKVWVTRVNITDKKRIEEFSVKDDLTGLYNRRYLNQVYEGLLNRAKRNKQSIGLALLDLDYFKRINDDHGHQAGDQALESIAKLAKSYFSRGDDLIFRMGGEEFLIVSLSLDGSGFVEQLKFFSQAVVELRIENQSSTLGVLSVSVGAGICKADVMPSFEQAYHQIDEALYQAKSRGRNQLITVAN